MKPEVYGITSHATANLPPVAAFDILRGIKKLKRGKRNQLSLSELVTENLWTVLQGIPVFRLHRRKAPVKVVIAQAIDRQRGTCLQA